jgi:hypothetical protein
MSRKKQATKAEVTEKKAVEPATTTSAPSITKIIDTPNNKNVSTNSINSAVTKLNLALLLVLVFLILSNVNLNDIQSVEVINSTITVEPAQEIQQDVTPAIHSNKPTFPSRRKVLDSFCIKDFRNTNLRGSIAVSTIKVQAKYASKVCAEMFQYPGLATVKSSDSSIRQVMSACGSLTSVVVSGRSVDDKKCRVLHKDGMNLEKLNIRKCRECEL